MIELGGMRALAQDALANILNRGFECPAFENLPTKLMFVVSELDEAHRDMSRGLRPAEELVDVVLRLSAILEGVWPGKWSDRTRVTLGNVFASAGEMLWPIVGWCTRAAECWRDDKSADAMISLEYALRDAWMLLAESSGSSDAAMELVRDKMAHNTTRPALNGHKRST